jgi:hypothetical protein
MEYFSSLETFIKVKYELGVHAVQVFLNSKIVEKQKHNKYLVVHKNMQLKITFSVYKRAMHAVERN